MIQLTYFGIAALRLTGRLAFGAAVLLTVACTTAPEPATWNLDWCSGEGDVQIETLQRNGIFGTDQLVYWAPASGVGFALVDPQAAPGCSVGLDFPDAEWRQLDTLMREAQDREDWEERRVFGVHIEGTGRWVASPDGMPMVELVGVSRFRVTEIPWSSVEMFFTVVRPIYEDQPQDPTP